MFDSFPRAEFSAAIVFIDVMETDNEETAEASIAGLADPRARYFHDPEHLAGLALARCFGWRHHVAWDAYLFYAPGARWEGETPPPPAEWFHALQDREIWEEQAESAGESSEWTRHLPEHSEADPEQFRRDESLARALRDATVALRARSQVPPP